MFARTRLKFNGCKWFCFMRNASSCGCYPIQIRICSYPFDSSRANTKCCWSGIERFCTEATRNIGPSVWLERKEFKKGLIDFLLSQVKVDYGPILWSIPSSSHSNFHNFEKCYNRYYFLHSSVLYQFLFSLLQISTLE